MRVERKQGIWSESAQRVLAERYLLKKDGRILETPDDMCQRVATAIAMAEAKWSNLGSPTVDEMSVEFYRLMVEQKFMPNSPTLMNAGKNNNQQLSACFVLPVGDSIPEIFDSVKHAAIIHKSGGGTGMSFSRLRPKGSTVGSTQGVASGPVSFMEIFDKATEEVKQGGTRRGANMGILRVDHPDILDFIECKLSGGITNFNISVAATDEFMKAVETDGEYDLLDPGTKSLVKRMRAREVFDRITEAAWKSGDPGMVFIDRANMSTANPTPEIELLEATNPCFTGNTLVLTLDGPVPFEKLAGKAVYVLSQTSAGEIVYRLMSKIRMTRAGAEVRKVAVKASGSLITGSFTATPDHRVFLSDGREKAVGDLQPGDSLASIYYTAEGYTADKPLASARSSGNLLAVNHKVVAVSDAGCADVYDGMVEDTHCFFIQTEAGGAVLVHNCGEQWLGPYDACNLGSINLAKFVTPDSKNIDWKALEETTTMCVRFLDDVIDVNPYPLTEVHDKVQSNRRIGLGIMGWADLLFLLSIAYNSEEALALADQVMAFIKRAGHAATEKLAGERGSFPNWSRSIYKDKAPRRNSTVTTIAPTGTISIIADCSSGIEPIFALAFQHKVKQPDGSVRKLTFINPIFERVAKERGFYSEEVMQAVMETGSAHGIPGIPEDIQRIFVTSHEIDPMWHIKMQAAWQKHVDNSISKTINLPNSASVTEVETAYLSAYDWGCLGITVFRDGCKGAQVLNVGVTDGKVKADGKSEGNKEKQVASAPAQAPASQATPELKVIATGPAPRIKPRPSLMHGYTRQVKAPEGTVNITMNSDEDGLFEVFMNVGKAGSDIAALAEALGRLISLNLRLPSPLTQEQRVREIIGQLRGIGGSRSIGFGIEQVRSLPDAVARTLERHLAEQVETSQTARPTGAPSNGNGHSHSNGTGQGTAVSAVPAYVTTPRQTGNLCPSCGSAAFVMEEGCKKCHGCGYSEC